MTGTGGWEFRVLGPMAAVRDGREADLGPARRRTTLAALVVDAGRVVPTDLLVERVWGPGTPDRPAAALHTYVSRLRSGLRAAGGDAGTPLRTEPSGYRLAVDPSAVDAVRFESTLRRARELRAAGSARAARETVASALDLWRGDAYAGLDGSFVEAEARRLDGLRTAARLAAAELDLERGDAETAVEELELLAARDPLHEGVQAALLRALCLLGRPADALRRYAAVREAIVDELGVEPGAALRDLHERMLRGDDAPDPPPSAAPTPAAPPARTGARTVGRDRERARVRAVVTAAWESASPVVVAVAGEAGIGKTRLLEDATAGLAGPGVAVAAGRCWQHAETPVLWPWSQVVRSLAAAPGPALTRALRGRAAPLHAIVPDLPGARADRPAEPGRIPLFDALTAFLEAAAADARTLVVLEDMHWADPASREMLEYLAVHADRARLAVLASVRVPGEDGAGGADLLGALSRTGRAERLTLAGLHDEDVRAYVADRTGTAPDPATVRALVERTEGNPFFLGELVRLLGDGPDVGRGVPDGVREVILRRIGRLPEPDRQVLRTASVLGRTFDPDLVETVCGLGADAVDDALDRATAAGFLVAEPGPGGEHRFTHALVVDSIRDDIGPGRRRRLHARAAAALRERAAADPTCHAGAVLHHLVAAGGQDHLDEAVALGVTVADAWLDRKHYVGAEAVLRDAMDLVPRLSGPTAEQRELSVRTRMNSLYDSYRGPAFSDDRPSRRRALELARRLAPARELTAALAASWATAVGVADFAAATAATDELARHAEATGDLAMRAIVHLQRGQSAVQEGRPAATVVELSAAIAASEHVDTRSWSSVLSLPLESAPTYRAVALLLLGRDAEAAVDLAATVELGDSDDVAVASFALGTAALCMAVTDRPARAAAFGARCVELSASTGLHAISAYTGTMAAWGRERVEPGSGLDDLRAMLAVLDGPPSLLMRPLLLGLLADVRLRAGDAAEARSVTERAVTEATATGNGLFLPQLYHLRAGARARCGDADGAAADRERGDRLARRQGLGPAVRLRWDEPVGT